MKASDLAAKLLRMVENHGDFPVTDDGYEIEGVWLMEGGLYGDHYYLTIEASTN